MGNESGLSRGCGIEFDGLVPAKSHSNSYGPFAFISALPDNWPSKYQVRKASQNGSQFGPHRLFFTRYLLKGGFVIARRSKNARDSPALIFSLHVRALIPLACFRNAGDPEVFDL